MPSRARAAFLIAVVSVIQPAMSAGSPPASRVARYPLIFRSASAMAWRSLSISGVVVGGERGAVLRLCHAAEILGQVRAGQLVAEELVDRADDHVLAQVERGRVADLMLADEVAARRTAVVEASVVRVADHLAVAQAAGDQAPEQVRPAGVAGRLAGVAVRAARFDRLLGALVEVRADEWRLGLGARPCPLSGVVPAVPAPRSVSSWRSPGRRSGPAAAPVPAPSGTQRRVRRRRRR